MKTIEEMALDAGDDSNELFGDAIERFAALVRKQALEEAVTACESERLGDCLTHSDDRAYELAIDDCCSAIRALAKRPT